MNLLNKLYNGEVHPLESAVPDTEEYKEKVRQKNALEKKLIKTLPPDMIPVLEEMCSLYLAIADDECSRLYAEGVRFGIHLMIEIEQMDAEHSLILPQISQ